MHGDGVECYSADGADFPLWDSILPLPREELGTTPKAGATVLRSEGRGGAGGGGGGGDGGKSRRDARAAARERYERRQQRHGQQQQQQQQQQHQQQQSYQQQQRDRDVVAAADAHAYILAAGAAFSYLLVGRDSFYLVGYAIVAVAVSGTALATRLGNLGLDLAEPMRQVRARQTYRYRR